MTGVAHLNGEDFDKDLLIDEIMLYQDSAEFFLGIAFLLDAAGRIQILGRKVAEFGEEVADADGGRGLCGESPAHPDR